MIVCPFCHRLECPGYGCTSSEAAPKPDAGEAKVGGEQGAQQGLVKNRRTKRGREFWDNVESITAQAALDTALEERDIWKWASQQKDSKIAELTAQKQEAEAREVLTTRDNLNLALNVIALEARIAELTKET
jgi:hypothetical protein